MPGDSPITRWHVGERCVDHRHDLVMIDVAGHGDRCGAGAVVLAEEVPDVGGPDRADGRPSAGGVAAEPVVAEHLTSQRAQRHVVERVVVHGQLLEDHLALLSTSSSSSNESSSTSPSSSTPVAPWRRGIRQ